MFIWYLVRESLRVASKELKLPSERVARKLSAYRRRPATVDLSRERERERERERASKSSV